MGLGYASARWAHSEALEYVREAALAGALFSNDAAAAYIHTDTAAKHRYIPCDESKLRPRLTVARADGPVHVLWFHRPEVVRCLAGVNKSPLFKTHRDWAIGLPWLAPVAELADGVLLEFLVENAPETSTADLEPASP